MLVLQSTYDKVKTELLDVANECQQLRAKYVSLQIKYMDALTKVKMYKQTELLKPKTPKTAQFTQHELKQLRSLVHPDKHGGKELANELTKKLNALLNS